MSIHSGLIGPCVTYFTAHVGSNTMFGSTLPQDHIVSPLCVFVLVVIHIENPFLDWYSLQMSIAT